MSNNLLGLFRDRLSREKQDIDEGRLSIIKKAKQTIFVERGFLKRIPNDAEKLIIDCLELVDQYNDRCDKLIGKIVEQESRIKNLEHNLNQAKLVKQKYDQIRKQRYEFLKSIPPSK